MIINRNTLYEPLFQRNPRNPILRPSDWPYSINTVFNPAATRLADGTTLLLCRVEDRRGQSHLSAARSSNGLDGWQMTPRPRYCLTPKTIPKISGASKTLASPMSPTRTPTTSPTRPTRVVAPSSRSPARPIFIPSSVWAPSSRPKIKMLRSCRAASTATGR